ncbi:hypothetical protein HU200_066245 [Digitaria exilis]|uniref:Uncharacterized protein n=1 Tax=Digitaria exilis TaxID=1010633 RepID=A0A834ZYI5_9POAL|nr:hypothetical protein HU200_066245 [Digitaria exilis]
MDVTIADFRGGYDVVSFPSLFGGPSSRLCIMLRGKTGRGVVGAVVRPVTGPSLTQSEATDVLSEAWQKRSIWSCPVFIAPGSAVFEAEESIVTEIPARGQGIPSNETEILLSGVPPPRIGLPPVVDVAFLLGRCFGVPLSLVPDNTWGPHIMLFELHFFKHTEPAYPFDNVEEVESFAMIKSGYRSESEMERWFYVTAATGALAPVLVKLTALLEPVHDLLSKLWGKDDLDAVCEDWMAEARELSYDLEDDINRFLTLGSERGDSGFINKFMKRQADPRALFRHKDASELVGMDEKGG